MRNFNGPIGIQRAFLAGYSIQIKSKENADYFPKIDGWSNCDNPLWNWGEFDYKISSEKVKNIN